MNNFSLEQLNNSNNFRLPSYSIDYLGQNISQDQKNQQLNNQILDTYTSSELNNQPLPTNNYELNPNILKENNIFNNSVKNINTDKQNYLINNDSIAGIVKVGNNKDILTGHSIAQNAHKVTNASTSWIGNSFGSKDKWVQLQISALYVTPQGICFTDSQWDESGREAGIYKQGDIIGKAESLHGWGRTGGVAVTANNNYLYVAMKQDSIKKQNNIGQDYPPSGVSWFAVRRYNLNGQPAPFVGGFGYDRSMLIISNVGNVTGLATSNQKLFVSDYNANLVHVYYEKTMTKLLSFPVSHPGSLTVDNQGNLWIINADSNEILQYSPEGKFLGKKITHVVKPTALAMDNKGQLLVAENGPAQQVLIYSLNDTPKIVDTLGVKGGLYSYDPGVISPDKLYGLSGVGVDKKGNIYVSLDGFNRSGATIRQYASNKTLQWELLGTQFVDGADVDPATDGLDVYTKDEHFAMDYSQPQGKEWKYKAYTLDPFRYPDDPRLHTKPTTPFIRSLEGQRFLYITDMYSDSLLIYRFDGEIAVPSGMLTKKHTTWPTNQPEKGMWLWRDLNGNGQIENNEFESISKKNENIWGWEVDSQGDIWQASDSEGIWHYSFQGLDSHGVPIYSKATTENFPMPQPFNKLQRIKYFPETDTMYLGGYTVDLPKKSQEWGLVGTEIISYTNWSKNPKLQWRIPLPHNLSDNSQEVIKAMDIAGDRIFAVSCEKAEVYMYDKITGAYLDKFTPSDSGWVDIPYGLRAYQRQNGNYLLFVEEDAKAKITLYKFNSI